MKWSDIPFHPAPRTLRQFSGLWIVFFGGLACRQYFWRHEILLASIFAILAISVGILGLVEPRFVRPIFVGWMILALPIGWVVSHLMLAVLYFGIFTPVGLLFKLLGRDVMFRRRPLNKTTYWIEKPAVGDARGYFRQF